jgi:fumarylacetoacetate (FAA) hydrolase
LPRAYQWADGSAYVNHVELVRKARGAELPPEFWTDPLMYQGGSDSFVGPRDPILRLRRSLGHRPRGRGRRHHRRCEHGRDRRPSAPGHIRLLMLVNDVSLRNLIPGELAKGFGFLQSKPATAFSPGGGHARRTGRRLARRQGASAARRASQRRPVRQTGCRHRHDLQLSATDRALAKTRELEAGSIIGSGTVSNKQGGLFGSSVANGGVGYCCIAELRMYETIEEGKPKTPFMRFGDRGDASRCSTATAPASSAPSTSRWSVTRLPERARGFLEDVQQQQDFLGHALGEAGAGAVAIVLDQVPQVVDAFLGLVPDRLDMLRHARKSFQGWGLGLFIRWPNPRPEC